MSSFFVILWLCFSSISIEISSQDELSCPMKYVLEDLYGSYQFGSNKTVSGMNRYESLRKYFNNRKKLIESANTYIDYIDPRKPRFSDTINITLKRVRECFLDTKSELNLPDFYTEFDRTVPYILLTSMKLRFLDDLGRFTDPIIKWANGERTISIKISIPKLEVRGTVEMGVLFLVQWGNLVAKFPENELLVTLAFNQSPRKCLKLVEIESAEEYVPSIWADVGMYNAHEWRFMSVYNDNKQRMLEFVKLIIQKYGKKIFDEFDCAKLWWMMI